MTEIPEDVMKAADSVWLELSNLNDLAKPRRDAEMTIIARAILAERERCANLVRAMLVYADTTSSADEAIPAAIMDTGRWLTGSKDVTFVAKNRP